MAAVVLTGALALSLVASAYPTDRPTLSERDLATIPAATVLRTTDRQGAAAVNYYPAYAYRDGVSGVAVIDCKVTARGELDRCVIVAEFPRECFFGAAARRLAQVGIIGPPRVVDGQPTGGEVVRLKVQFGDPSGNGSKRCR